MSAKFGKKLTALTHFLIHGVSFHRSSASLDAFLSSGQNKRRPAVIFPDSARDNPGNTLMYEEMCQCSKLFTKFGGHPMAAGLTLPEENIDEFREQMNAHCPFTVEQLQPKVQDALS